MVKVNNKNTRMALITSFGGFYYLWTYFKPFSGVPIVVFKQVNVSWVFWAFSNKAVSVSGVHWCGFTGNITILFWLKHLTNIKYISSKNVRALPLKLLSFQGKGFMSNIHACLFYSDIQLPPHLLLSILNFPILFLSCRVY